MSDEKYTPLTVDEHEAILVKVANAGDDVGTITESLQQLRDNYTRMSDNYIELASEIAQEKERYSDLQRKNMDLFLKVTASENKEITDEPKEEVIEEDLKFENLFDKGDD